MLSWIQSIDWMGLGWIQTNLKCGILDALMPLITKLGDVGAIWLLIAAVLLFQKKYRKCGIMIILGVAVGFVVGNLCLKPLVARPRPCWLDSAVTMLVPIEKDFSFPSGHTLASVIAATILAFNDRKFAVSAILLAVFISFSRLYLYLHFPSDVLASVFLGIILARIVCLLVNKIYPLMLKKYKASTTRS